MRKELIQFLCLIIWFIHGSAFCDDIFLFPRVAENSGAIEQLVVERGVEYAVEYHNLKHKGGGDILVVVVNSGSGLLNVDAYVYGCETDICLMLAMRHGGNKILVPEMQSDHSELVLKSGDGTIFLRVPFPD